MSAIVPIDSPKRTAAGRVLALLGAFAGGSGALTHGAVADLTVYAADPEVDPNVLLHPERIILRGRVVH